MSYSNYYGAPPSYNRQSPSWAGYGTATAYGQSNGHRWNHGHRWRRGRGRGRGRGWGRGRGGRPYYGAPGNYYGNKKIKEEPEYPHFCNTCNCGFNNIKKYNKHMSLHVKCSFPDCPFAARETIVTVHWNNTHAPGKIRIKLDTPEEIAKWREERQKNYPTAENVENKKKLTAMREETEGVVEPQGKAAPQNHPNTPPPRLHQPMNTQTNLPTT